MAQYPHRVLFEDGSTYLVRANDSRQAVRRAMRQYRQEQVQESQAAPFRPPENPQGRIVVRSLTPKKVDDQFYPRVGGLVIGGPCATEKEALDISVKESLRIMKGDQP